MSARRITDWSQLPLTLRVHDVAAVYDLHPRVVRDKVARGDADVPQPNFVRPMRWRRSDVRRHYHAHSMVKQRRELLRSA